MVVNSKSQQPTMSAIKYQKKGFSNETLLHLYEQLAKPRLIEEKMLNLLRQGRISKWFSGIGQEAISVGAACALLPDEVIFTMHRNLGVFTARNLPLDRMFCQWQGKRLGYTKARDRSFHFGALRTRDRGHDLPPWAATFAGRWCGHGP
jgi:2-oxoisovalerate dehydrogenase E1 component